MKLSNFALKDVGFSISNTSKCKCCKKQIYKFQFKGIGLEGINRYYLCKKCTYKKIDQLRKKYKRVSKKAKNKEHLSTMEAL